MKKQQKQWYICVEYRVKKTDEIVYKDNKWKLYIDYKI